MLSPVLFSLSSDYRHSDTLCPTIKYADDTSLTGLTGLISMNDESSYRKEVDNFVNW